ncbi:MAG: DUF559 domain-containing protein [Armatimonadetes bacterium]|nr:DUF559 domain-containing protein [Armatimonadota bacterium]
MLNRIPGINTSRARELRQSSTEAESLLWEHLRSRRLGGWKFRRQEPIHIFIADFFCCEAGVVVELDGEYHDDPKQAERDAFRESYIQELGYRVIRFRNSDVIENIQLVAQAILQLCQQRQSPLPS